VYFTSLGFLELFVSFTLVTEMLF